MTSPRHGNTAFVTEDAESGTAALSAASASESSVATTAISGTPFNSATSITTGQEVPPGPSPERAPRRPGIAEWLDSPDALGYQGQWVLLSSDYVPIAVADGPSPLLESYTGPDAPLIVYVSPADR